MITNHHHETLPQVELRFLDGRTRMQEEKKQDLQKCAKDIDILDRELAPQK